MGAGNPTVLAEQVADLAGTHANVTGRNIHELADVAMQLCHEALAEAHDLFVTLPLGVEVGTALGAAHGETCKTVFQRLLKTQELQYGQIDRGVEAQAALVGADGRVELNAVAAVYLHMTVVVHPGHTEAKDTFRLHEGLNDTLLLVFGVPGHEGLQALQHLQNSLVEFPLLGVACYNLRINPLQVFVS